MSGFVWLVGAGPGDPELLTLKASRLLQRADLILYDALVAGETLELAPRAQRFFVGKRAGRPAIRQETIERLMIRAARRGRRVVRLKGGDPFVFGRGGEEALALAAAGVPFEIVPGVSSAVAAPGLAGIPVTHRGMSAGFAVVTGHDAAALARSLQAIAPGPLTLVVLMGLANRDALARLLLARGFGADTPAAVCLAAASSRAFTWTGRLAELGRAELPDELSGAPGTIVIGEVVGLARSLRPRVSAARPLAAARAR